MDFDEERIYFSHQNLQSQKDGELDEGGQNLDDIDIDGDDSNVDSRTIRRHFKEFLRNYRQGPHRYLYRDRLLRMYRRTFGDEHAKVGNNENDVDDINPVSSIQLGAIQLYPAVEVDLAHVGEYDAALLGLLLSRPSFTLPIFELAAADALKTFFFDARGDSLNERTGTDDDVNPNGIQDGDETNANATEKLIANEFASNYSSIQILLKGNLKSTSLRAITASHMNKLLQIPGIVIQAARIQNRAARVRIRCSRCSHATTLQSVNGPFSSLPLPSKCQGPNAEECGLKPYAVIPDESDFVDQQTLKLQESPETVPTGEMPRSIMLACERSLVDRAPPGTRISVTAIPSLFQSQGNGGRKSVYLRVVGMQRENMGTGAGGGNDAASFSKAEEEAFRILAKRRDIYSILYKSIAPSISGSYTIDIKKAMVCQLFGGSRKKLPDKMRLRGDINVLLLGDPSTAKSQFLKFMQQVAPIAVYTSGKGSSAAGLTASVIRDAKGEFYIEGGAMVLADGGIVCIDEFDKMRPTDRVAIHEAMEQQTISIAKAGITTVLNSRSAVLAAANPVYGRYDDLKTAGENIDLMTTILSRFDLIFLVRDVRDEERDRSICRHVMGVHMDSRQETIVGSSTFGSSNGEGSGEGGGAGLIDDMNVGGGDFGIGTSSPETIAENALRVATSGGVLDVHTMKKYVQYCKAKCSPRLSEQAGDVLASAYVKIRDDVRKRALELAGRDNEDAQAVIPITVRQLEALVRLSESLAKMRLEDEVHAEDISEALRLFKVSTMAANAAGNSATVPGGGGGGGNMSAGMPSRDEMYRAEAFLRSRLVVGAMANKKRIIEEASGQGYSGVVIARVLAIMCMRGEVLEKNQSRMIKRVK